MYDKKEVIAVVVMMVTIFGIIPMIFCYGNYQIYEVVDIRMEIAHEYGYTKELIYCELENGDVKIFENKRLFLLKNKTILMKIFEDVEELEEDNKPCVVKVRGFYINILLKKYYPNICEVIIEE